MRIASILLRAVKMIDQGTLFVHVLASTRRVMVGFLVSSLVAIPFGIFLGSSRKFKAVFDPLISLLWLGITHNANRLDAA